MQSFHGISAAPKVQRWLDRSQQARILNVFPESLNLVNDAKSVVSIVVPAVGNGPFALVVDCEVLPAGIETSDQVVVRGKDILVGGAAFHVGAAKKWDPVPNWLPLIGIEKQSLIEQLEEQLRQATSAGGFAEVFYPGDGAPGTKFISALKRGSDVLIEGLREDDTEKILTGSEMLGGLGVGLTPSGDDFLIGAMYGLWATVRPEHASNLTNVIWAGAAGNSTTLSREWLAAAVAGEAVERWHGLVSAVVGQHEEDFARSVREILKTGQSSGSDALCGFVQVLKLELSP